MSDPRDSRHRDVSRVAGMARTMLFVPGDRPERFDRAAASGTDLVLLDLEDAVREENKASARRAVSAWVAAGTPVAVRINPQSSAHHQDDVTMVAGLPGVAVMLPKAGLGDVARLAERLPPGQPVVALIESATGVLEAAQLARHPAVRRLALGHLDLAVDLGVDPDDRTALLATRSQLVLASRAAGLAGPVDGVSTGVGPDGDQDRLTQDVLHARRLGMAGKLCIHPRQVGPAAAALKPSPAELEAARRVLADATSGVGVVDGRMVDAPVVARARILLEGEVQERA